MLKVHVADGRRADTVVEFEHEGGKETIVKTQGMYWSSPNRVYMAFSQKKDDGSDPESMRIGVYDPTAKSFHKHKYNSNEGFVASFAYQSSGGVNTGFVFGGAYRSGSDEWTPAIHIVKFDLSETQQAQIEYTG